MEVMKRSCGAVLGGPWRVARGLDCNVEVGRGLRGVHSGSLGLWMKQLRDNFLVARLLLLGRLLAGIVESAGHCKETRRCNNFQR
jgi:hypothetical protein